jgi:RNA polymerase sigma-70 factor (ECF subfamily)
MTPAVTTVQDAPPDDPVRAALSDPDVRNGLLEHAAAVLGRWLADRPNAFRAEAAAEAVQETQLRALQRRHEYDPAIGPVRNWLHGILSRVMCETARSLGRLPVQPRDPSAWERLAVDLATPDDAVADRLAAADYLSRLPSEQRELLRLRYYANLDHREIARRLGISAANARVRLCRALAAARVIAGASPEEAQP